MTGPHGFIRKFLHIETLLTIGVTIVMGGVIYLSITDQREHLRERMTSYAQDMKLLAYAGIKHPMSVGDSPSIEKQLLDMGDELENTEIVICDFNQQIIFATNKSRIGAAVSTFTGSRETLSALQTLLESAIPPRISYFEEEKDGVNYLVTIHSIYNDKECHHCHGDTRKVLGGLLTRQSTDATYLAIATLRNHTIIVSIIGVGILVTIIFFLLARLVTKPITVLAGKAEELARGNLSVSVPVKSADSIGVLAGSFNFMAQSIKDQIEYANSLKVAIADPLVMVDTAMVVTFMNESCARITGYSKQETEGKLTCRQIFKSDICTDVACDASCPIKKCLVSGNPGQDIRTILTNRDGKSIPVMASASALKDARGNITGAVEIFRDITVVLEAERLRYIQSISEREEEQRKYLESRAENLLDILSQASNGNLKVRAEQRDSDEVMDNIARHTNQMLDNLEKVYEKISSLSKGLEMEVAHRTAMLRERTLMLERAIRELRELDRLKSAFLANMSHELRTPMNSIIGYTELLLDKIDGEINEEQEKSLLKVENNAKHLLQLINDILDMSKIESGKIELDIQEIDTKEMIESVSAFFQPAMEAKNIFMQFDFAASLPAVFVDEDKVRQIFNNLVGNAIKFTAQGGITIHAKPSTLGVAPGAPPLFVEICVEDTGIGIKKEDMAKLFDKFTQINVAASRQYEGTGLGLSIARGLVVLHKGVIWVESEYGVGSRFFFTLPAQRKVMENLGEPIIELAMAEQLAVYFDKPVDLFLKEPSYIGKPVKCWEYARCGQTSCPAYGNKEHRCWLICGVHCKGVEVAKCPEKIEYCKACEIIENIVIGEYNPQEMTGVEDPAGGESGGRVRKTILVIDDNPEVIELIRKNIGSDYHVVGQLSGEGAVEKAREIKPAAITLDIMMPGKDGWEVLRELKKEPETQDIPVIIVSIVDEKKTGFSLGATEYLVKPIDKQILLHKLKNLEKLASIQHILIIDNEAATVDILGHLFNEAGYRITQAFNNTEAIQAIQGDKPDLIVLNPMMPEENGFDVIEYIKTEKDIDNVPLILITNSELSEEDIRELNGRVRATLDKSLLAENDLLELVKNTLKKI
ncbi:MAG: response regulator [Deltaproteobacteria bacterium]|nr:response regulator [Deltaproteobacteria bacterium]